MTESVVGVHEAKTNFSKLLDRVEQGEEVLVARRGRVVAKLVPATRRAATLGSMRGMIALGDDFDSPLPPDVADALGA